MLILIILKGQILPINITEPINVDLNDINCNSNVKRKRRLFANKNEWTRKLTKTKEMHGEDYIGYHREGKTVFHDTNREKRTINLLVLQHTVVSQR